MIIRVELLSDCIFGSGQSIPGLEDISVIHDDYGFPYISGTNFKGNLREAAQNLFSWTKKGDDELDRLFGRPDNKGFSGDISEQITVSDLCIPYDVRKSLIDELEITTADEQEKNAEYILNLFTDLRTFTALEDNTAKAGTLRMARCINFGLVFYGNIEIKDESDEPIIEEALSLIKWLGTMRTRGFGQVKVSSWKEGQK